MPTVPWDTPLIATQTNANPSPDFEKEIENNFCKILFVCVQCACEYSHWRIWIEFLENKDMRAESRISRMMAVWNLYSDVNDSDDNVPP